MNTKQPLPTKIENAGPGRVFAICLEPGLYAYVCRVRKGILVFPVASRGGLIPLSLLSKSNWRWFASPLHGHGVKDRSWRSEELPEGSRYAGSIAHFEDWDWDRNASTFGVTNTPQHWFHTDLGGYDWTRRLGVDSGFWMYAGVCISDSGGCRAQVDDWRYCDDLKALVLSDVCRANLVADPYTFLKEKLPEMILLERPFAQLIDGYDVRYSGMRGKNKWEQLEVHMPPGTPPPEDSDDMEEFLESVLTDADLGMVGEVYEDEDRCIATCDVLSVPRAASALRKALKKAGYSKGFVIKEKEGKQRTWSLSGD